MKGYINSEDKFCEECNDCGCELCEIPTSTDETYNEEGV